MLVINTINVNSESDNYSVVQNSRYIPNVRQTAEESLCVWGGGSIKPPKCCNYNDQIQENSPSKSVDNFFSKALRNKYLRDFSQLFFDSR